MSPKDVRNIYDYLNQAPMTKVSIVLWSIAIGCGVLPLGLVLLCFGVIFFAWGSPNRSEVNQLNDSQNYFVDLSAIFTSDWSVVSVLPSYEQEDIAGWDRRIAGSTTWWLHRAPGIDSVRYQVVTYIDSLTAQERFRSQITWVFENNFGSPNTAYPFNDRIVLQDISSEREHLACVERSSGVRCAGLLLYFDHIVFTNVFLANIDIESAEATFSQLINYIDDHWEEWATL
jgi:hypothetical protein